MSEIIHFHSTRIFGLEEVGGKGKALIEMMQAGMPVPPGFVLPVTFFQPWLDLLRSSPHWAALTSGADIGVGARLLQAECSDLVLNAQQKNALEQAVALFRQAYHGHLYAVRSSSPEEDLEGASFAGGYETTLGVPLDALEPAILRSFTSSFDERVFLYKKEHGIQWLEPRIAVVVQQQVDADCAGVAFSLNPLNNCYDEVVINANHGLGESVVGGEAEPDLFVVDKISRKVLETRSGGKQVYIRLDQNGGTRRFERENHQATAISPDQAHALTDLVIQVEAHYHKPVDIEWAIADGKIYLLQARPITTYLPLPPEMVTAPGEPKRLYANSTLIEQGLQGPLSVLGTDFLHYVLNKVGGPIAEGAIGIDGITFTASGGYYMNVSHAQMLGLRGAGLAPGSFGDPRILETMDNIDMQEYTRGQLPARLKALRGQMVFKMLPMITSILGASLLPQRILNNYKAALPEELRRLTGFSGAEMTLHEQALALAKLLEFFYGSHGIPMVLAGQIAQRRIKQLFNEHKSEAQDHLVNLGVSLPGNKTTEMGQAMYALAASTELERYTEAEAFLSDLSQGRLPQELSQRWQGYMAEFGMRCPGEVDPATPRPKENPAQFFQQLKNLASAIRERKSAQSFFEEAREKREAAYQALYAIAMKKGRRSAKAFEKHYQTWLIFGGYRETPKHYVIMVVDLFRRAALEIADQLVAVGRLDTREQIFDLNIADVDSALVDPTLDLRILTQERSVLIHKIRKSKHVARLFDSRGKIFFPPRRPCADGELSGVPISPGVIQGRVKVLLTADEKPLLLGEILVARATDPGWTPLFINARGIILEIGGALQHGAVVAREYGIPCVSGVEHATDILQDGQLVEVDGSSGVVRVLDGVIPVYA
jgi:pyruvate,water dikinase